MLQAREDGELPGLARRSDSRREPDLEPLQAPRGQPLHRTQRGGHLPVVPRAAAQGLRRRVAPLFQPLLVQRRGAFMGPRHRLLELGDLAQRVVAHGRIGPGGARR